MNRLFDPDLVQPGAETDLKLLHHVLDWKKGFAAFGEAPYVVRTAGGLRNESFLWPVSTDWTYSRQVIDQLEARGFQIEVADDSPNGFVVRIACQAGSVEARAETQALAFTRAALKGVMACLIIKR